MIKCEVVKKFNYKKFKNLKNVVRANESINKAGELYVGDTFECEKEIAEYLSGNNPLKETVVKVLEVKPKEENNKKKETIKKKKNK